MLTKPWLVAALLTFTTSTSIAQQQAVIESCTALARDALRTYQSFSDQSAFLSFTYSEYCHESETYSSLSAAKQTSFSGVYKQVNSAAFGSSTANANVQETYEAFCKEDLGTVTSSQSAMSQLATIHRDALEVVKLCVESARSNVRVAYVQPTEPTDAISIVFSTTVGTEQFFGAGTRNAECTINGEVVPPQLPKPKLISSEAFTLSCIRTSTPIEIYGLQGDHFPRAQISLFTGYSPEPLDVFLPEAVVGPLQDRLHLVERSLVPVGAVLAFDLHAGCPKEWSPFGPLDGRTVIGAGGDYEFGEQGGEATHTLTVAEMPRHNHGGKTGASSEAFVNYGPSGGGQLSGSNPFQEQGHTHPITAQGGNQAHNNMQPFMALTYCRKD